MKYKKIIFMNIQLQRSREVENTAFFCVSLSERKTFLGSRCFEVKIMKL